MKFFSVREGGVHAFRAFHVFSAVAAVRGWAALCLQVPQPCVRARDGHVSRCGLPVFFSPSLCGSRCLSNFQGISRLLRFAQSPIRLVTRTQSCQAALISQLLRPYSSPEKPLIIQPPLLSCFLFPILLSFFLLSFFPVVSL